MELKCSLSGQISFMLLPVVFPGPKQRCSGRGPASGGAKCVHGSVCVFVRVCVRASARVSVGVLRSKQLQQKPFGNRISSCQSPHLALVIVGGGEGRSKKCVSARVRARARGWWGQVGNSPPMLIKAPPASSPKPSPLCCLLESETSKGRVPVRLPMQVHPYL